MGVFKRGKKIFKPKAVSIKIEIVQLMLQHSSPNKALREASVASSKKLNAYYVEMAMRKDTFDRVCAFKELPAYQDLSAEMKRMVEKTIVEGKRNGLHLDEETRNQVISHSF